MEDWEDARSLADLGELTVRWLRGQIQTSWTQDAPPDAETAKIRSALVRINRRGFVTDFSQPGEKPEEGCAQRAAVSGYCSEDTGRTLASLMLCSDLIVLAYPPGGYGGYQIPITVDEYHPYTWCGLFDEYHLSGLDGLNSEMVAILRESWYIVVIDPNWGRQTYLWRHIQRALEEGVGEFRSSPAPSHGLETDFVF